MPLAHEHWFVTDRPAADWSFAFERTTLLLLALALVATLVVRALARVVPGVDVPFLARLVPWLPFAVRVHLAVSLIGLLSDGAYLAPHLELHGVVGWLLGILMAVTAVLLFTGWWTRAAAAALVLSGPLAMIEFGAGAILQRADVLGLALFLLAVGPGRWSADAERRPARTATLAELALGVWLLRVCVAVALISVAYAEKLANPELALRFLDSQTVDFNVLRALGVPVSDLEFVRIAGAIEVLFGLLVLSGALPQAIAVIAGVPFNLTLYFFGTIEMLGHLPVYATLLVLLVLGSDARTRPMCSRLLPPVSWGRAVLPASRRAAA